MRGHESGDVVGLMGVKILLLAGLAILVLGSLFEGARRLISTCTQVIPENVARSLNLAIEDLKIQGSLPATAQRLRVVPQDLSLAAHVRGMIIPRVIVSGGMLVGLLRRDAAARAILAHELAHIKHYDRVLPSLIVIVLTSGVWSLLAHGQWGLINLVATSIILMHISHRREYAADAHAVAVLGSSKEYIEILGRHSSATTKQETWFHPSSQWRIRALQLGCPVLRPSKFWFIFWLLYIFGGASRALLHELDPDLPFLSALHGLVSFEAAQGGSMCLLGFIGLLIELAKLMVVF